MLIDCDTCRMRDIACGDCVISLLLGAPQDSLDLNGDERAAFGALAAGGLAPPLRLVPVRRSHGSDVRWPPPSSSVDTDVGAVAAMPSRPGRTATDTSGPLPPAVSGL